MGAGHNCRGSYASLIGLTLAGLKRRKGMNAFAMDLAIYAKTFFFCLAYEGLFLCCHTCDISLTLTFNRLTSFTSVDILTLSHIISDVCTLHSGTSNDVISDLMQDLPARLPLRIFVYVLVLHIVHV